MKRGDNVAFYFLLDKSSYDTFTKMRDHLDLIIRGVFLKNHGAVLKSFGGSEWCFRLVRKSG